MSKPRKFLVALDKESNRLVWAIAYQDWPRLVPGTPHLSVFLWASTTGPTLKDINQLKVQKDPDLRNQYMLVDPPEGAEWERLMLLREKCKLNWHWLKNLYQLSRSVQGYLPGVPLGLPGSNDRALFEQEAQRINDVIAEEIANNHWRIWAANSQDELDQLRVDLFASRQNNPQGYF